jgi:hypothetical protein
MRHQRDQEGASPNLTILFGGTGNRSGKPGAVELLLEPWATPVGLAELGDEHVDLGSFVSAG